jgi:hypothetical protein
MFLASDFPGETFTSLKVREEKYDKQNRPKKGQMNMVEWLNET